MNVPGPHDDPRRIQRALLALALLLRVMGLIVAGLLRAGGEGEAKRK